jgi:hypothetical protein
MWKIVVFFSQFVSFLSKSRTSLSNLILTIQFCDISQSFVSAIKYENIYSVEQNDGHLVCFGIFAHVNIPAPLYFFLECLTITAVKKCHQSNDNCYNLLN